MTPDVLVPWFPARSDATLPPRPRRCRQSTGAVPRPALALALALGFSCACRGGVQGGHPSGGGSSGQITVSPLGDAHLGPQNDFDPAELHRGYVLANATEAPLSWEARISEPWLALGEPRSGVLAAGDSVVVQVDVDPDAANQGEVEPAVARVDFVDTDTGALLASCTVSLESSFSPLVNGGWTTFAPSADTRMVFVSSSGGDDRNDGFSQSRPKRTLAAGQALMRHGSPDWLLLRRGDVWHESFGRWTRSGRALGEPMLISSYGDALERPLLLTGDQPGIRTNGGGGSPPTIDCLAVVGLHFRPDTYAGAGECVGAQMLQPGSHLLIEDCEFEGYSNDIVFQGFGGRHSDFRLRRSVIVDAWAVHAIGGHAQGLYAYAVDGLLIEENVFDHNGWNEGVAGAGADIYSHNIYIDNDNTGVVVRGNIIANGSSHGLQLRPGGEVVNNLFVRNSIALLAGGGNNPEPAGVRASVLGNVIVEGRNIDAANPRGWGLVLSNLASGRIAYNVVANNQLGLQPNAMTLDGDAVGDNGPTVGVHDTEIVGNVFYNWGGGIAVRGDRSQVTNILFSRNDLQNATLPQPLFENLVADTTAAIHSGENRFFNQVVPAYAWTEIEHVPHSIAYWKSQVGDTTSVVARVTYREPDRSVSSYNVLAGGAFGVAAFLAEARQQSHANWRPAYTAALTNRYLRAGF